MTGPESLLARWSRRKSDGRTSEGNAGNAPCDSEAFATRSGVTQPSDVLPPFDLASLPTLDSISGKTDLRAFFDKGVPAELTVAALRRGWSTDPAIRDFIGLSENSWDFNDPGGIPGFGTLEPEEIQRLLAQLSGADETNEVAAPASAAPLSSEQATSQPTECDAGSELPQDISTTRWIRIRHGILRKIPVLRKLLPRVVWTRRHRRLGPLKIVMFGRFLTGTVTAAHCPAST